MIDFSSYAAGAWVPPEGNLRPVASAVTGDVLGEIGADLDFAEMIAHATGKGGLALRAMTFHDRARMIKALALHLREHREALYQLSYKTGATLSDSKIDIIIFSSRMARK